MNSKTEQHSSSDLLNIPSSEFVTQAYAKASEINLSFPDVSAMLRAAAARIDVLKVLVSTAGSATVERFTPDCKMHMNHEMAYMRPNPNGTFVSLGDYLTLQKERNDLNAQVQALAAENAMAKSVISECRGYFIAGIRNTIRPTNEEYLHMQCETLKEETPVTAAILREVGAKALDDMATEFGQIAQTLKPNSIAYRAAKSSVFKCVSAAARIRAGEVPNV